MTPRRWGKTTSVAMFVAAMLWCVPDMWISVYSTGRRASNSLAEMVAKFVCHLDDGGGGERISKRNQEELFLKGDTPEDTRRLFSYPSTVQGTKGTGGKVLILEEAARLDPKVFQETIAPLLGVAYTALLGISTPMEEDNQYSQMMNMKDGDGSNLFRTLEITLVCDACKQKGDKTAMVSCPHMSHEVPPWKQDSERQNLVKALMSTDPALLLRETAGLTTSSANVAFSTNAVDCFERRVRGSHADDSAVSEIYIAVDPSGGGNSETAIMSCCFTADFTLVVRTVTEKKHIVALD